MNIYEHFYIFLPTGGLSASQAPGDITVMFISPTTVKVSWKISLRGIEKYDVMYKPTNARYHFKVFIDIRKPIFALTTYYYTPGNWYNYS